jgi:phage tail-like protein
MSDANGATQNGAGSPLAGYRYRVLVDGKVVAGVSTISPLRRTTEVIEFREGAKPGAIRRLPGVTAYDPIRLERGVSLDWDFEAWAGRVCFFGREPDEPDPDFRKDITIEALDESGDVKLAYHVFRCWPSDYIALEPADEGQPTALEVVVLQHEGWERVGADTVAQRAARAAAQTTAPDADAPAGPTGISVQLEPLPGEEPAPPETVVDLAPAEATALTVSDSTPAA